jgi:membrane protein DedA with SNARE-associated domain
MYSHLQNHLGEIGFLIHSIRGGSYIGIFLFSMFVSYLIPLPEAVVLILFGYVAKTAHLNIVSVFLLAAAGGIIGDNILYRLSFFGNRYVERFNLKMRRHKLIQYEHLVIDNIGKAIFFLRFITGIRFFGPVIAGTLGARWKKFFLYDSSATLIHAVLFISIGYFYSHRILAVVAETEIIKNILLLSSVFIVGILLSAFSKKEAK